MDTNLRWELRGKFRNWRRDIKIQTEAVLEDEKIGRIYKKEED